MSAITGSELVARYKKNYALGDDVVVTEEMIRYHLNVEKALTLELRNSTPENRWEIFEKCYTRLYSEMSWLNTSSPEVESKVDKLLVKWELAVGKSPMTIYEIGSGKGELVRHLARLGHTCKGTEITPERGEVRIANEIPNLEWAVSDGIHLAKFEAPNSFDIIITNHVVEHFHPDDLETHLSSANAILKADGKYIICTPHRFTGPHDVSRVFDLLEPQGMHLKEYIYSELVTAAKKAGFSQAYYAFMPARIEKILNLLGIKKTRPGAIYLGFVLLLETILSKIPNLRARKNTATFLWRAGVFPNNINLVIEK